MSTQVERVAGVDVGGAKKGFHAVAFQGRMLSAKLTTCSAAAVVAWCREQRVSAIGIDAPSRWSLTGRARSCERELAHAGMSTFSTPSRAVGEIHPLARSFRPHLNAAIGGVFWKKTVSQPMVS
ncbi:MAG TPA: DUF429 domain-containing protein [Nitrospira sp.]